MINSNSLVDKKLIWDRICIGSDFDEQIDSINAFKKATDFYDYRDEPTDCPDKSENGQLNQLMYLKSTVNIIALLIITGLGALYRHHRIHP